MPELPEVETIRRNLRDGRHPTPAIMGKQVLDVQVKWQKTIASPDPVEFQERIKGQTLEDIQRRGKYLLFCLTTDTLLIHLRMSGDLLVERQVDPVAPHHRLLIDFTDGMRLSFNDPRKFGRAWLVKEPGDALKSLGPEPLDALFTVEEFYKRLQATRRQIKPLLLDQSFIAGLGNIYTDEALHLARIHPLTKSNSLDFRTATKLLESIRYVLTEGIRKQGASIDWVYRGGDFQNYFRVYRRTGLSCPECSTKIERIVVGQRGTHYCPFCQPESDWNVSSDK
jgi:formamidopyrimidine-DNA glycosylase